MICIQLDDLTPQQQIAYCLQAEAACKQANARDLHAQALCGIGMALTTSGDRDQASPTSCARSACSKASASWRK